MEVVLVYLEWFRRNSLLKCVLQPKMAKNSLKPPILGVQGRSRLSMLVLLESSSSVLVMISMKSVSICNRFHARWANSGKITISMGGTPIWCPRSRGISSPRGTKLSHKELETLGYHRWRPGISISADLESVPGRGRQTYGRTDRQNRHC